MPESTTSSFVLPSEVHDLLCQMPLTPQETTMAWLVGGCLRDLLEQRMPDDIDLAFAQDLTPKIKIWAKQQGGNWFWLDRNRNQSRVLFRHKNLQFDFAPLRAADILADLKLRDFTVNSLALPLEALWAGKICIIDPSGGQADLQNGILRSCGPTVLYDDPLRILKGIRHHAQRGWQLEPRTISQMTGAARHLSAVAGERIKIELGQILAAERFISALELMTELKILDPLLPGIELTDVRSFFTPLAQRMAQLEELPSLQEYLQQSLEEGLSCKALLNLALLISLSARKVDYEPLRLATRSRLILQIGTRKPVSLKDFSQHDSSRVAALKLERLGANGIEQVLFALLHQNDPHTDQLAAKTIASYQAALHQGRIVDLLNGKEISTLTGLPAGPLIDSWQKRIKAAEITGEISDKSTAIDWVKRQFSD